MAITKLPKNAIADNAINADKIEDGTVAGTEITGTVSAAKLNSTLDISGKTVTLPNTSVTSNMLANTTIANAKLSNSSITVRGTARNLGDAVFVGVDVDWQSVITGDTTMAAGRGYFVNTTSGAISMTLPASASAGDTIAIKDYAKTFATNNLIILRNSHKIQGVANNSQINTNRASVVLVYVDSTKGWLFTEEHNVSNLGPVYIAATGGTVATSGDYKIHSFTGDANFVVSQIGANGGPSNVDYIVVAGGGGGGNTGGGSAGGGGAGGFREGYTPGTYTASPLATSALPVAAQTYPVTVGGGGASMTGGSNSVFSTITSAGGGKGAKSFLSEAFADAGAGGSGGGGQGYTAPQPSAAGAAGNTPPTSPPQGNPGGDGAQAPSPTHSGANAQAAAGGGGAGGQGVDACQPSPSLSNGGAGGVGATSSITASPVVRSGGGGGGKRMSPGTSGAGGSGGGGAGGQGPSTQAVAGTANTGGGGGGAGIEPSSGAAGGSGIVIIRYRFQ